MKFGYFWYGNFCQIKTLSCVFIHFIHHIWHRAISGSSPKLKWLWQVYVLNQFRTLRQSQLRNSKDSQKRTSSTVSESIKNDGIIVSEVRKGILSGTNCNLYFMVVHFFQFKYSLYFLGHTSYASSCRGFWLTERHAV